VIIMRRASVLTSILVAAGMLCPAVATAQESNFISPATASPQSGAGWSLTPSLSYAGSWDDNVLVRGTGDLPAEDFVNTINPRAGVVYNGRRGQLSASYDGAFQLYRELSTLNSYDQRGSLFAQQLLTRHVALFVRSSLAKVPTTELAAFVGVPFQRTGSRIIDGRGGVDMSFSKRTSMIVSYDVQWAAFDVDPATSVNLQGGHSQGASASLRHAIDARLTATADYNITHAVVDALDQGFDIQNWWAGAEYKLSEATHMYAAGGVSRLGVTELTEARIGPAWRAGLAGRLRTTTLTVEYVKSFVPAYGFGGTMQNEELSGRAQIPLARRLTATGGAAWRRNDPLTEGDLPLRSFWLEGAIGYFVTPTVRLEGFYSGTRQTINRPGGQADRNRLGFQISTARPMRIR